MLANRFVALNFFTVPSVNFNKGRFQVLFYSNGLFNL